MQASTRVRHVAAAAYELCSAVASERLRSGAGDAAHAEGKRCAARYWFRSDLPRVFTLSALCRDNDDSYARMQPD